MNASAERGERRDRHQGRKRLPHQYDSSRAPPMIGPSATPRPVTAPQTPMAAARCLGSRKVSVMMARVVG